jgi:hypothetical protein
VAILYRFYLFLAYQLRRRVDLEPVFLRDPRFLRDDPKRRVGVRAIDDSEFCKATITS